MGFATAHLEVIWEPGRPVSQAGALLAGQDELGERRSLWSLSVSPRTSLLFTSLHHFNYFSLSVIHHGDRSESSQLEDANKFVMMMAGEQVELDQRRKSSVPFVFAYMSIYLFLSGQPPARGVRQGLGVGLWCVCVQVCVCLRWGGSA